MVACRLCGNETSYEGTQLCQRCWELEHRIQSDPELAIRIISETLASRTEFLNVERNLLVALPCSCSGPCGEEGLTMEHQCNRCKRLEAIGKIMLNRANILKVLHNAQTL